MRPLNPSFDIRFYYDPGFHSYNAYVHDVVYHNAFVKRDRAAGRRCGLCVLAMQRRLRLNKGTNQSSETTSR
eukprot:g26118.t1